MTIYGKILWTIVVLDLISTVAGLESGIIEEANPLMAYFLTAGGLSLFILVKLAVSFAGIGLLEHVAESRLLSVKRMKAYYMAVIVMYCFIYITGSALASFYI